MEKKDVDDSRLLLTLIMPLLFLILYVLWKIQKQTMMSLDSNLLTGSFFFGGHGLSWFVYRDNDELIC